VTTIQQINEKMRQILKATS